jgi:hypothetical protein
LEQEQGHCINVSKRSTAEQIDALIAAYEQAVDNFENSPGAIAYSAFMLV